MRNNIKLIIVSILFIIFYLVLGIYGKFIFCTLVFIFSMIYGLAKEKKLFILSVLCILLIPNIFTTFKIDNLNFDQNGLFIHNKLKKKDSYYYAICPFISNVCPSIRPSTDFELLYMYAQSTGSIPTYDNQKDILGNVIFWEAATKREKYLDNKALSQTSILYKTIFIPFSKEDLIIYNYNIGKHLNMEEILIKNNKCELLLYGAQNGWINYKIELIKELENKNNKQCLKSLDKVSLYLPGSYVTGMTEIQIPFLNYLKTNNIYNDYYKN